METINNMATAAAKAVWGDNDAKKEPVSGVNGDVSKGEPYDAGNLDSAKQEKIEAAAETPARHPAETKNVKPDTTAGQNDTRSPEDKTTDPNAKEGDVDTTGEGPNSADFDGPGPKPIAEVAKEHGGDAGNLGKDGKGPTNASGASISSSSSSSSEEELPKGPTNEKQKPTGDEYVKSSGLNADGGDFDASNPGAGREADRLMEEKGMHKEGAPPSNGHAINKSSSNGSAGGDHTKEKVSLKDKIKAKLHH